MHKRNNKTQKSLELSHISVDMSIVEDYTLVSRINATVGKENDMNKNLLSARMVEHNVNNAQLAEALSIDEATLYRKKSGMYENDERINMVDTELRLYVQYLHDLAYLNEQMYEVATLIDHGDTYGISSPRIKSAEEAKYQTSPKVYTEDAALARVVEKELKIESLAALRVETSMKRIFCLQIQKRICVADLSQKEMKIMYLRYFRGLSLRVIAKMMWSNKDYIARNVSELLLRI